MQSWRAFGLTQTYLSVTIAISGATLSSLHVTFHPRGYHVWHRACVQARPRQCVLPARRLKEWLAAALHFLLSWERFDTRSLSRYHPWASSEMDLRDAGCDGLSPWNKNYSVFKYSPPNIELPFNLPSHQITIKTNLMSSDFPSIWLEHRDARSHPTLIAGFYREWTRNGLNSVESQIERMEIFT